MPEISRQLTLVLQGPDNLLPEALTLLITLQHGHCQVHLRTSTSSQAFPIEISSKSSVIMAVFRRVRKVRLSVRPSVCLSVCMEHFGSHYTDFHNPFFENILRKLKFN